MTDTNKNLLKALSRTNYWGALLALREEMIGNWKEQGITGTTEFEYLANALRKDGKIEGVNALLMSIENMNNV